MRALSIARAKRRRPAIERIGTDMLVGRKAVDLTRWPHGETRAASPGIRIVETQAGNGNNRTQRKTRARDTQHSNNIGWPQFPHDKTPGFQDRTDPGSSNAPQNRTTERVTALRTDILSFRSNGKETDQTPKALAFRGRTSTCRRSFFALSLQTDVVTLTAFVRRI